MIQKKASKLPQIHSLQRRTTQGSVRSIGSRRSSLWDGAASNSDVSSAGEASDLSVFHADLSREQARRVAELHEGFLDRMPRLDDASWEEQKPDQVKDEVRRAVLDRRSQQMQEVWQKVQQVVRERRSWISEELVQAVWCVVSERISWIEKEVLQELQRVFMKKRIWQLQEIIQEGRKAIEDRRLWLTKPLNDGRDDDILQRRRPGEENHAGSSYYIVLPENGVPAVEAFLSSRVRAELLNEEFAAEQPLQEPLHSPGRFLEDDSRAKQRTRPRNPWYLPPSAWYSGAAPGSPSSDGRAGSQLDDIAGSGREEDSEDSDSSDDEPGSLSQEEKEESEERRRKKERPRALTQLEKDTLPIVEAYRQSLKGQRLPHFLQ